MTLPFVVASRFKPTTFSKAYMFTSGTLALCYSRLPSRRGRPFEQFPNKGIDIPHCVAFSEVADRGFLSLEAVVRNLSRFLDQCAGPVTRMLMRLFSSCRRNRSL